MVDELQPMNSITNWGTCQTFAASSASNIIMINIFPLSHASDIKFCEALKSTYLRDGLGNLIL